MSKGEGSGPKGRSSGGPGFPGAGFQESWEGVPGSRVSRGQGQGRGYQIPACARESLPVSGAAASMPAVAANSGLYL